MPENVLASMTWWWGCFGLGTAHPVTAKAVARTSFSQDSWTHPSSLGKCDHLDILLYECQLTQI